jgi:hypothetical protein
MTLRKEGILSSEEGSSRSHYVESSLWKRLWTYRETDYSVMNELVIHAEVYTIIPTHCIFERRTDEDFLKFDMFSML